MTSIEQLYDIFCQHPQVTTDSRDCPQGSMFFALKGERFDGNQYAADCLAKGCACAVVDDPTVCVEGDARYVLVDDVLRTLQLLSRHHRRVLGTTIIGITGTNGKTTTKELCAAVLSRKYNIHYTQGNFNNSIGVPKTLLQLKPEHQLAVVEMGASHPGDIEELVTLVEPQYGLITNVGRAHLLGFGSFEGVCRTKGELYDFLRSHGGKAFVNQDNEYLTAMAQGLPRIDYVEAEAVTGGAMLRAKMLGREVQTHLVGAYNLDNLRAAATVGLQMGVSEEDICAALSDYVPSNNRSQFMHTAHNDLIVDAYNANPTSMAAALDNFEQMDAPHKMCILGMMGELGDDSRMEHERLLQRLQGMQLEEVWLVGSEFESLVSEAEAHVSESESLGGEPSDPQSCSAVPQRRCGHIVFFSDVEAVKQAIAAQQPQGRTILIKGSNSTHLFQLPPLL